VSRPASPPERLLPAWSLRADEVDGIGATLQWQERVTREWALGGSTGAGVDVCILDSGVDAEHPLVGGLASAVAVEPPEDEDGEPAVVPDELGDVVGHGTACAGIVRSLAPECRLHSIRVLGAGTTGSGNLILTGLRHAIEQGHRVVNLSLSTTKRRFAELLHDLADAAYFKRTVLVASAHNMPVESYPWRFASVISVGSHEGDDSLTWYANPDPPVEFFARGVDLDVAWTGGGTMRCTGNSFAAPHIAGIAALVLGRHPELTPFQLKSVLYLTATNTGGGGG
jgi:subtilisin family serine protease